ncbi:MAG TPA: UvrD-helicase domain-containing protein, partial [Caulobacter sp.]|nr:UvrD-helicase domain-containing protein [Caulobacter sp.]
MDLFAREFPMPRGQLRSLHIAERLSGRDICGRLGAPAQAVAQQLLDALLLPIPKAAEEDPTPVEAPLNPSQDEAVRHEGPALLLEAGPGTGKTRTLVARVRHLLDHNVDPENILVLTFSNRAAAELVDRISLVSPKAAATMWIGTFHSFGLDLVRRFSDRLERPGEPRLLDTSEAVMLMEREFLQLDFEHYRDLNDPTRLIAELLRAVSRAKDEVVCPIRYRELADDMPGGSQSIERA